MSFRKGCILSTLLMANLFGFCYADSESSCLSQALYDSPTRLLLLQGDDGTVACRIYGKLMSATIPRFSENWRLESATRSILRMLNLTAVRGIPGSSLVGPADYFGNLEKPHEYFYTVEKEYPPQFSRIQADNYFVTMQYTLKDLDNQFVTTVKANWISGNEAQIIHEKQQEYHVTKKDLQQSLFLYPGILEIDRDLVELRYFDPRGIDLSSFKARLVDNKVPFQITTKELPSKDEYRLISYRYEAGYADWQIEEGSGLFLETHSFSQTIMPLEPTCEGFVTLARTNETLNELEVIGIKIPFGYTLIIDEGCIHGDTNLSGFFLMGMTSDHTTMRTADTVFLKYPETKKNVRIVLTGEEEYVDEQQRSFVEPPYVIYKGASEADRKAFKSITKGMNFIFNPFSSEYWR